jgi:hypothetical protein
MRFCMAGMWGRATYFAVNASYSENYKFSEGGVNQFFLARVLIGDHVELPATQALLMPPVRDDLEHQFAKTTRYDSVKGHTAGSDVFMVRRSALARKPCVN